MALRGNDKSDDKEGCYAVFTKSDRAVELAMEEDDDALVCTGIRTTAEAMEEDGFVITGSKPADEGELTMTEMYKRQITYIEYHERQIREQREQAELNERLARQAEQRARQAVRFAEREKARELEREKDREAEREKDREAEREKDRERARREQREAAKVAKVAKVAVAEDVRASVAKRGLLEPPPPAEDDMKCVRVDLAQTFAAAAAVAAAVAAVTADAAASAVELIGQQQQQEEAAHQQQQQQQEEGGQQQQQQQPEAEEKKAGEKKDEKEEEEEEAEKEEAVEEEDAWDHTWEVEADRIAQKSKKRGEILNESFVDHKDGDKLKHVVKVVRSDTTTAHGVLALAKELMPEVEFKSNSSKKVWTVRCVVESDDAAREVENLFRAYFGLEQTPF
jgi:hypothetical protein